MGTMSKLKSATISRRTVEGLSVSRDTVFWDRRLPGFGVRVYPSGSKVYVVQTRANGRSKRIAVGRHGVISANEARRRAAGIIASIKAGREPDVPGAAPAEGPTVAEFAERYLAEHVTVRLKPATVSRIGRDLDNHILPALGKVPMGAVGRERVMALHYAMRETPTAANGAINTLSAMYNLAEIWEVLPQGTNPCRGVVRYRSGRAERFLSEEEFARLGRALSACEDEGAVSEHGAAAIRLLMLTGCRSGEILALRWRDVDLQRGELNLPDSKTGPKKVPLSPSATRVFKNLTRRADSPWVLPGERPGRHLSSLQYSWRKVRARADLADVRLHDLRHSFASRALALGEGLTMIGKLLGHTQVQTTARYAHLARDSVKASAERVAASLAGDLVGSSACSE